MSFANVVVLFFRVDGGMGGWVGGGTNYYCLPPAGVTDLDMRRCLLLRRKKKIIILFLCCDCEANFL